MGELSLVTLDYCHQTSSPPAMKWFNTPVHGQPLGDGVRSEMLTSLTQHALQTDPRWLASPLVVVRAGVLFRAQTSRSP